MGITVLNRAFEVLTLDLQGEVLAIDASYVREILDLVPITQVPNSQPFVNGLINVRGKVVPLADLRLKLGMERSETTIDSRIVVVEVELDGAPTTVGVRADKVYEVTELASASVTEAPKIGMRWRPEFIRCIGKRGDDFVIVLNLPAILATGLNKQSDGDPKEDSAAA
ncbi:MAG TPA: chemotaxis protein CheW [Alphaproteobacteria bacterium]|nr:chemotaxis protein CheW [Alphaproteobacteria bacterium]